ncbi:oligosaccharide flippase family protein [Clostridium perfringens]
MKSDSIKKNMIFQFAYQIIIFGIPLVIAPYLTRTLGDISLGVYTYTNSIAYYFVLFCMLGITRHGQRVIVSRKNNEIALRKTFWSLFTLHSVISLFGLLLYILFCLFFCKDNLEVYYVQGIYVLSALFDITWLFYGLERFKSVVIKNFIVKVLVLILIFTLVKNPSDLITYTFIMTGSVLLSQISLLPTALIIVKPIRFGWNDVREHIKPLIILSVSVLAVSLYTIFNKTLLGIMSSAKDVAFYEYSNNIVTIPKMILGVIGTVLFPRACNCVAKQDFEGIKKYFKYSLLAVYFIGFGSVFGLVSIADLFSVVYYGKNFAACGGIIKALAPAILIIGLGDIFRSQFLIPLGRDVEYTACVMVNSIINLIVSFMLIPKLGIYGVVIGTLLAELFGIVYQAILIRKYIDVNLMISSSIPFIVAGLLMMFSIKIIKYFMNMTIFGLIFQIVIGGIVYIFILAIWFLVLSSDSKKYRIKIVGIIKQKIQYS